MLFESCPEGVGLFAIYQWEYKSMFKFWSLYRNKKVNFADQLLNFKYTLNIKGRFKYLYRC